ncbi:MAG: ComF family protein [Endomicrobia bacterium]|nr:ComF family protein [Endomicrobiia bacterium]MCL2507182.1 ComF family protein [Endomicrobiia bacterium]
MKKILSRIISYIFPITCSSCGKDLHFSSELRICQDCKNAFPKNNGLICRKCGLPLPDGGEHCFICRKNKKEYAFDIMRSTYLYKDSVRKLILRFKYSNRMFLAKDFGREMSKTVIENDLHKTSDIIIPVPLNIIRRIKRGYNQAGLLADAISENIKKPVLNNVLYRKKITKPQFKLSKAERAKNIKDSFLIKNDGLIEKKNILLVDDIATTSSTASACAAALKSAGASKVVVITIARD